MTTNLKWKLAAGAAAVAAAAAGGVAISSAAHNSPAVSSAGSTPSTQVAPQGNGPGGRPGGGRGFGDVLAAAATYLGLSSSDLSTQLQSGKTLAQIANATSGKSAPNLVAAMVAAQKQQLASAVQAGTLTQAQATQFESSLQQRIVALVNGSFGGGPGGFGRGGQGGGAGTGTPRTGSV
jgi:hypothetical protein